MYPNNTGIAPINSATVSSPNAIPLLLNKILLKAVSVIGIVILKNRIASIPNTLLLNANMYIIADAFKAAIIDKDNAKADALVKSITDKYPLYQ